MLCTTDVTSTSPPEPTGDMKANLNLRELKEHTTVEGKNRSKRMELKFTFGFWEFRVIPDKERLLDIKETESGDIFDAFAGMNFTAAAPKKSV